MAVSAKRIAMLRMPHTAIELMRLNYMVSKAPDKWVHADFKMDADQQDAERLTRQSPDLNSST